MRRYISQGLTGLDQRFSGVAESAIHPHEYSTGMLRRIKKIAPENYLFLVLSRLCLKSHKSTHKEHNYLFPGCPFRRLAHSSNTECFQGFEPRANGFNGCGALVVLDEAVSKPGHFSAGKDTGEIDDALA